MDFNEMTDEGAYAIHVLIPKPDNSVADYKLDIDPDSAKWLVDDPSLVKLDPISLLEKGFDCDGTYYDYDSFVDHVTDVHNSAIETAVNIYNDLAEARDPSGDSAMTVTVVNDITDPNQRDWESVHRALKTMSDSVESSPSRDGLEMELALSGIALKSLEDSGGLVAKVSDMHQTHYKALSPDVEINRVDLAQFRAEPEVALDGNTLDVVMQP